MRKTMPIICLFAALALTLCACADSVVASRSASASKNASVGQLFESAQPSAVPESTAVPTAAPTPEAPDVSSPDADVDLTLLGSTMVYSEVSRMLYEPEEYIGKTVKMTGMFNVFEGDERNYYACLIADAAACCANGIEFVWAGDHAYPDDYPELGADITVTGVFELYEEDGFLYSQLSDAEVSF